MGRYIDWYVFNDSKGIYVILLMQVDYYHLVGVLMVSLVQKLMSMLIAIKFIL